MFHGLRTLVLMVRDLDAAKAWYAEAIGHGPYYDTPYYVGFDVGGYELGLHPGEPGVGGSAAYFGVDDVPTAVARLVATGATVQQAAQEVGGGIVTATLVDPFGNLLGVIFNPHFAVVDMPYAASPGDTSDRVIVQEVTVALPLERVWALWTTREGLVSWLASDAKIELRPGGAYEVYFDDDAPHGSRGGEGNKVLSFLAPRTLVLTWNGPPDFPSTRNQRTHVLVEFGAVATGTHVRITHHGWPARGLADASTEWPATFQYFERAWGMVTRRLGAAT